MQHYVINLKSLIDNYLMFNSVIFFLNKCSFQFNYTVYFEVGIFSRAILITDLIDLFKYSIGLKN